MYERILVVEDDTDLRNLLVGKLMKSSYEIIQAEDGEQAVAKFFSHHPQLVLLDIMLPKMDGFEVMRAIREKSGDGAQLPPIVILSNFEKDSYLAQAKELNAEDYLIKSKTEIDAVCRRVEEILQKG